MLDALQILLPLGCCKVSYGSDKYLEPWRCNLLALPYGAQLPDPVEGGHQFVVVTAKFCQDSSSASLSAGPQAPENHNCQAQEPANHHGFIDSRSFLPANQLDRCSFRLHYVGGAPEEYPTLLDRLMLILSENNLHIDSLNRCLQTLKDEWLNKSKLLFQLTKQNHLDERARRELFEKITKCKKPADQLVVKFWQAGLSRQYKSFVMNRGRQNDTHTT